MAVNINIDGTLSVAGISTLTGNTSVGGTLNVTGATTVSGNMTVSGNITEGSTLLTDKYAGISTKDVTSAIMQVKDIDIPDDKILIEAKMDIDRKNRYVRLEVIDRLNKKEEEIAEDVDSMF